MWISEITHARDARLAACASRATCRCSSKALMQVIIVDSEPAARRTLREQGRGRSASVVGEYGDGATALADAIPRAQPQLLFLDIQMDPINGIDLARALDPAKPALAGVRDGIRHLRARGVRGLRESTTC